MTLLLRSLFLTFFALLLQSLLAATPAFALSTPKQQLDQLNFSIAFGSIKDNQGYGYFDFDLQEGWKTYWRNPGDAGLPLNVNDKTINGESNKLSQFEILWPTPHLFTDGNDLTSYGYSHHTRIPFFYQINTEDEQFTIHLAGEYAVCKVLCIFREFDEKITLEAKHVDQETDKVITLLLRRLPKKISADDFTLHIEDRAIVLDTQAYPLENIKEAFVEAGQDFRFSQPIIDNQIRIPFTKSVDSASLNNRDMRFTLVFHDASAIEFTKTLKAPVNTSTLNLFYMLLLAFIGGLILNIMPCVLPVVSLKLGQISHTQTKLSSKMQLSYTVLGILLSFMLLAGLVAALKAFGALVGWGFHFQQPVFVLVMMLVLIVFTFSQLGWFHLRFKSASKVDSVFNKLSVDSPLYHIFYGLVIALLATPCTAPFLGSAVGFALSQSAPIILLIFLFIALGLAFPYILLITLPLSPKALLPKPGNWLNYVKYIAAFLLYGSALWLLFVLAAQIGTLTALILFALIHLCVFLAMRTQSMILWFLLSALVLAPLYLNKLPYYNIGETITDKSGNKSEDQVKLIWNQFNEASIAQQIAQNKIVFIDITAEWCLTCKFNKLFTLSDKEVMQALSKANVYLMRGDMTRPDPELLNFIKKHERAGVPFNAVVKSTEAKGTKFIVLSEILDKTDLIQKLED